MAKKDNFSLPTLPRFPAGEVRMPSANGPLFGHLGHFSQAKYLAQGHNDCADAPGAAEQAECFRKATAQLKAKNDSESEASAASAPAKSAKEAPARNLAEEINDSIAERLRK